MTDEITLDAPETRIERFLAAAAGVDGITLDEPVTRIEKYLYKIAQGSGGVPAVEDADKGKYLHANESTGDLEWAEGGSGGAEPLILSVTSTPISGGTKYELDKTAGEIYTAFMSGQQIFLNTGSSDGADILYPVWELRVKNEYVSVFSINHSIINANFTAYNATVKPFYTASSGGND